MDPKLKNMLIAKYVLMIFLALNIIGSIFVIIFDLKLVNQAKEDNIDWFNNEIRDGYYAQYWFISCILIMISNIIISLVALYGAHSESSSISLLVAAGFSVIAVYGAFDPYTKKSFVAFLAPLFATIMAILFGALNFWHLYEQNSTLPGAKIHYVSRKTVRNSTIEPQVNNEKEMTSLNVDED